ncbi:MAG: hypothetical protein JWL59_4783 [Chthoniobacteraceae bacterium]|nr:hypothetical protein [Chthoniobacteraceae bacterium]
MKTNIYVVALFCLGGVLNAAPVAPASEQIKELQKKELQLEKKEAELERQRLELEAAKKQLKLEETAQRVTMRLEGDALFDSGKAQLRPEAQSSLEKIAAVLVQFPSAAVLIEGHTDSKGKPAVNLELSEKRALAVQEFLKKRAELSGIHFTTRGLGETKPIASNDTEEGRQQNRRVEVVVEKAK